MEIGFVYLLRDVGILFPKLYMTKKVVKHQKSFKFEIPTPNLVAITCLHSEAQH